MTILSEGFRKARKNHWCDGWRFLEDWRHDIPELELCRGINKGDEYFYQVNTFDGLGTFKCCKSCKEQSERHNILMSDEWVG